MCLNKLILRGKTLYIKSIKHLSAIQQEQRDLDEMAFRGGLAPHLVAKNPTPCFYLNDIILNTRKCYLQVMSLVCVKDGFPNIDTCILLQYGRV